MKILYSITVSLLLLAQVAQAKNIIIMGVQELAEAIVHKGGKEATQELAEFGGKQAIEEVLEKAAREGGDDLVERVIIYGKKYGISAVKTIDNAPALYIQALDEIPESLAERALWAVQRDPAVVTRLLSEHGSDALKVAAKYPGVGTDIVAKLGDDGIRMARDLTEKQAIILARHADEIVGLSPSQRSKVVDAILTTPERVIDYMGKHPNVFGTAAGIATLVALKDDVLGKYEEITINPDGSKTTRIRGFIERMFDMLLAYISPVIGVLALIVAGLGAVMVWSLFRRERVRVVIAEKTLDDRSKKPKIEKHDK